MLLYNFYQYRPRIKTRYNRDMKILYRWAPLVLWMSGIYFLSSRTRIQVSDVQVMNFIFFKTLHVIEYAFLYVLTYRSVRSQWHILGDRDASYIAYIVSIVYAASDEIHQTLVPTREGRARDVIIDAVGVIIAWILIHHIYPNQKLKRRNWVSRWQWMFFRAGIE